MLSLDIRSALDGWREGEGSLYRRLADALTSALERHELLPGARLPPERALAVEIGVGRATVAAAYELLERRGLVERRQGRGTHITGEDGTQVEARAAELTTSLQRNVLFRRLGETSADAIDLLGTSAPPSPRIRDVVTAALDAVSFGELMSGHGYVPLGYPPLRSVIAKDMSARGLPTAEDEILVTGGAQQAISLLCALYVDRGGVAVLEDPTFPGAIDAFRTAGGRILTVPVHHDGADIDLLHATIARSEVRAVYLMPTFHNPTGAVMPEEARRELARFSRTTGVPVIEDNTLAELALGCVPPLPLGAYARGATIATIGSLSKLYWPGLRVGYVRAPRSTITRLGRLKAVADLGTSLLSQAVAVHLVAESERIRATRCRELEDRLTLTLELLERLLPEWSWRRPQGGLSLWARLPDGSSSELALFAHRRGVSIAPGSLMSATGRFDEFVRLPFDHEEAVLREGIRRLAAAWTDYRSALRSNVSSRVSVIV